MIGGKNYYLFRLDRFDGFQEYRVAESVDDLHIRFSDLYMRQFTNVTNVGEVTKQHVLAIQVFLNQQLCNGTY